MLSYCLKQKIKRLMTFRIVKEKLLYIIGIPRRFADVDILKSQAFCGQFGQPERVVINYNPKEVYEGQVAVYVHYKSSVEVAVALKVSDCWQSVLYTYLLTYLLCQCLNGLKISGGSTLKCSFGTSKYCSNFLTHAYCESFEQQSPSTKSPCPFIHYLERRRDKVIQDDNEFKDYLAV